MELTLILGPMKSGKSFELISHFASLRYADINFALYQSARNVRNESIWSRNGISLQAKKVTGLAESLNNGLKVVGIDEVHMFGNKEAAVVEQLLKKGVRVIASGLDTDYRGEMFPIIKELLSLGPREVKYRRAVCEVCKSTEAVYTQVFRNGLPVLEGLPPVIPEDGRFEYKPVCRKCFLKKPV